MRELLFTVWLDETLIAAFAAIKVAENFAASCNGNMEVRSRGDGYVYHRFVDGVEVA